MKYINTFESYVDASGELNDDSESSVDRLNNPALHVIEMLVSRNPKYYAQVYTKYKELYPNNNLVDDCTSFKKAFEPYLNTHNSDMANLVISGIDDFLNYLNTKN